jgi:hypothetical protein
MDYTLQGKNVKFLQSWNVLGVAEILKLESGCQQHSNNRSSMMMYGSHHLDFIEVCYIIHELRKKSGRKFQEYLSPIVCSVQFNFSDFFDRLWGITIWHGNYMVLICNLV